MNVLLAGLAKAKPKTEEKSPEEEMGDGLDTAAEEVLAAFKADDASALKSALKSFVSMYSDYSEGE